MKRYGFTTGSCAAAAAKAATYMLLTNEIPEHITIDTPAGIEFDATVEEGVINGTFAACSVRKDAGDDPDVTDGILIRAEAELINDGLNRVYIEGGSGVGTVTRPGLDMPVGSAAINSVPRQMIVKEAGEVLAEYGSSASVSVVISVPEGKALADKTFNPRLGIEGGISIIGTTGIVEPMSTKALIDTIRVELRQIKAEGASVAVISPGNYGLDFMRERYGYDLDRAVKCSNFIGETLDIIGELGFDSMLLCGHIGKLIKLSGGIMNTHSAEADCRMELMAAAAFRCGAGAQTVQSILDSLTTEEAYGYMLDAGIGEPCMKYIADRISFYLEKRADGRFGVEFIMFSNANGLIAASSGAEKLILEDIIG